MKIRATKIKGGQLKPGELFSSAGPYYWGYEIYTRESLGEKVYIRMETPLRRLGIDPEEETFRIEIVR